MVIYKNYRFLLGWMAEDTRVNIKMIRSMVMVNLNGLMVEYDFF